MIAFNTLVNIFIIAEILMVLLLIAVIIIYKKKCLFAVSQIVIGMAYIAVIFQYFTINDITDYSGGVNHKYISSVETIENLEDNTEEYKVTLDTGRVYYIDNFMFGEENNLVTNCKIVKTNIFNIKTYTYGDIIVIINKYNTSEE